MISMTECFNIRSNTKPFTDSNNNQYVGAKSVNMNQKQLINFVNEVIIKYTKGRTAALYMDSLGYQHNKNTMAHCNNNNITVYRIPPNTTGWLQPCDIVLFDPAKQMVKKQIKVNLQKNTNIAINMSFVQ